MKRPIVTLVLTGNLPVISKVEVKTERLSIKHTARYSPLNKKPVQRISFLLHAG